MVLISSDPSTGNHRRFANCVLDGLAIIALLGDGALDTHSPATKEAMVFQVREMRFGRGSGSPATTSPSFLGRYRIHLSQLAFRSEDELDGWLRNHGHQKGAIVAPQTLYDLGDDWYATRFDAGWKPASAEEATALFAKHGIVDEFWSLR